MGVKVQIGRWSFSSKIAAETYIRDILESHQHNQRLRGEDDEFMRALIDQHPRGKVIIDCGIDCVYVEHVPFTNPPLKRFAVYRTDRSRRDFAWRHAIYPRTETSRIAGILRGLIAPQIQTFKYAHYSGICEHCKVSVTLSDCQVDHIAPETTFEKLMAGWLHSLCVTADDITIIPSRNYQEPDHFEDPLYAETWIDYHQINARLQCVCRRCNASTLRKSANLPQEGIVNDERRAANQ